MAPQITPVETSPAFPAATTVVVIGGGIVGLSAALALAERGVPVVVLEKGRIAGEQSSRNLGWVRKVMRSVPDLPMAMAAERLWAQMPERVGTDCGFRQAGITYVSRTQDELAVDEGWLESVKGHGLDSRMLTPAAIAELVPGSTGSWVGGIHTPSDGRAEPTLASSAIARAALAKGAIIVENCAVRTLTTTAGAVSGVVTERGEIRCEQVLLAGGVWSRRFLANHGVELLTLPLVASVLRTEPMEGPTDCAVGAADFSFRKRLDGGYTIADGSRSLHDVVPDSFRFLGDFLPILKREWRHMRLGFGAPLVAGLRNSLRGPEGAAMAFEATRTLDPQPRQRQLAAAYAALQEVFPVFKNVPVVQQWAGMIDATPDAVPVISTVQTHSGLVIATGFSGHGFGIGPAAGRLAADLVTGATPIVDPRAFRYERFIDGTRPQPTTGV